jgi:hypothetical protein
MEATPFTIVGTASAVLALSKAAWKLGISLSKLDRDTETVDTTIKNLAGEVKSLSNEYDLIYTELDEVLSKSETGSLAPFDVDGKMWNCLATQVEETSRTIEGLEMFVKSVRVEDSSFMEKPQHQRKLENRKDEIASIRTNVCRHTDNLGITLLLIKMRVLLPFDV